MGTYVGFVLGARSFTVPPKGDRKKPIEAAELFVQRLDKHQHKDVVGVQVDRFIAWEDQLGDYRPKVGDGIKYNLYQYDSKCAFVLPEPSADVGE